MRFLLILSITLLGLAITYKQRITTPPNQPEIIIQDAEQFLHTNILLSNTLSTELNDIQTRFYIHESNQITHLPLPPFPSSLNNAINQVSPRIRWHQLQNNAHHQLTYPTTLLNDTTPPQITTPPHAIPTTSHTATIHWTTTEPTTHALLYSTTPNQTDHIILQETYTTHHTAPLTNLTPNTTYYYRLILTDQSNNTQILGEYSFEQVLAVYIPLIIR